MMGAQNEGQGKGRDHDQRGRDQHRREEPALSPVFVGGHYPGVSAPFGRRAQRGSGGSLRPEGTEPVGARDAARSLLARLLFCTRAVCPAGVGVGPSWARRAASAMAASARAPGLSAAGTPVSAREPDGEAARLVVSGPPRLDLLGTWPQIQRHSYPIRAVRKGRVMVLKVVRS
jgi:hypothetical protein